MPRHTFSCAVLSALAATLLSATAFAQPLAMAEPSGFPFPASIFQQMMPPQAVPEPQATPDEDATAPAEVPSQFHRQIVAYPTHEAPGTIVIDTPNTYLYYVLGQGRAIRYGIGVGRDGFTWSGTRTIGNKQEWPDWHPPAEMIARQPYLPRFMAGGPGNPLGARAMYLAGTLYRIHGTNAPETIGKHVSSGCIRLTNADVEDLYNRVTIGAKVVVLPDGRYRAQPAVAHARAPQSVMAAQAVAVQAVAAQAVAAQAEDDAPLSTAGVPRAAGGFFGSSSASRLY